MWLIIGVLLIALFNLFQGGSSRDSANELTYSDFITRVEAGQVKSVTIQGQIIKGVSSSGQAFTVNKPNDPNLVSTLLKNKVDVKARPAEKGMHPLLSILISWLPIILIIAVWILPEFSGCRAMPSHAPLPTKPIPMPAPMTANPIPILDITIT